MISLDADVPTITVLPIFPHNDNSMPVCGSERHERVLCQQTQLSGMITHTIGWILYYWLVEQNLSFCQVFMLS